ncbi:hypothetical protein N7537_005433 [Penicillium hordei]|uniref:Uncharacterized protein n=1 Tax=Penicillium hordei TaxID=40994 RepID=A0AAD6E5K9_9EURO|nr:uncharacterized protein N7537_005433 [Penicillium hordei]KAJ5602477.1 hypothetical protein N7537_005433 [Penicillium hordei]
MVDTLLASVRAYEKATPGIFGPREGLSHVYVMTDVSATSGMTIGPAMAGFRDKFGYTSMNWVFDDSRDDSRDDHQDDHPPTKMTTKMTTQMTRDAAPDHVMAGSPA